MSVVPGIVLGGTAVPTDSADTYAVTDPVWGKGGLRTVATIADRNAIPIPRLEKGMLVHVIADGNTYALKDTWTGGLTVDADWQLFTSTPGVATRYISPTGSNSNDGLTALTPWETPEYAISQIVALSPSAAIINCANGGYTNVTFDSPSLKYNCDITFVGDETAPSNVTFQNSPYTFTFGVYATSSVIRFYGIHFEGSGTNAVLYQEGGIVYFRNCKATNFAKFATILNPQSMCYVFGGLTPLEIKDTDVGFSVSNGATLTVSTNITVTQNPTSPNQGILFELNNANFVPAGNNLYRVNCVPIIGSGWIFSAAHSFIYTGTFCVYEINDGSGLGDFTSCLFVSGTSCNYQLNATSEWMQLKKNTILWDNASCVWGVSNLPVGKIILQDSSQLISPNYVRIGTPPIILIGDDIVDYVQYEPTEARTKIGLDNRYYQTVTFSCFGKLPYGVTNNDLGPQGISNYPYQIYIAHADEEVFFISVRTRIPNNPIFVVTDTYTVYKNNSPTTMLVNLTTTDHGTSTAAPVSLVAGDYLSIKLTTDIGTNAEDVTVTVGIRRRG